METQSTERFSDRVANYIRYRPDYPPSIIEYLAAQTGLSRRSVVADVGSGTGIFTRHLLRAGCTVFAIEPNEPMRAAAEEALHTFPDFISVNGTAGQTTLDDGAADLIVCAQAFHWFNTPQTKAEFKRILKQAGSVALIWNNRITDADAFSVSYEELLQQRADYREVNHQNLQPGDFAAFFKGDYEKAAFPNAQLFDEEGLIGRAASSSYVPPPDTPAGAAFTESLSSLFRQHQKDGMVRFAYRTEVYTGRL